MKKFLNVLLAMLLVLSFAGCTKDDSNNGGEKTKVVFWHTLTDHDEEVVQEIVDDFNASQSKWEVEQLTQPLDGFEAKVYEAVTNGTGPNLVWLFPGTATEYVEEGLALDFGQYFTDADYKNRISEGLYATSTDYTDGKVHAVVGTLTGPIVFYNKQLLEKYNLEMATTWDELYEICKTVVEGEKAEGKDIMGFGPDSIDTLGIIVLQQLGLNYISDDKKADDWTNEKFVEWVNWWKAAEEEGVFKLKDPEGYHSGPYGRGEYFCYMGSSAGIGYITPDGFDIVCGQVPLVAGGKQYTETTVRALVGFTQDNASANEGAAEFAKFFAKAENNLKLAMTYGANSPYIDVADIDEYKTYVANSVSLTALNSMVEFAGTRTAVIGQTACKDAITRALTTIIVDGADTVSTLETEVATANAALAE